ncbi:MAG: magnesium-translocating P-type ATPase [Bdellovibrionales bacterium]|nr:magnesium-translocating P-type ATPase [Bdellovibrionales bacterium]
MTGKLKKYVPRAFYAYIPSLFKGEEKKSFGSTQLYFSVAKKPSERLRQSMGISSEGLTPSQVQHRLELFGRNEVTVEAVESIWVHLVRTMINPFVILLILIAIISFATDDRPGGIIISVMVTVSVALTFFQERRSNQAAEKLKSMVRTTATVLRRGADPEAARTLDDDVTVKGVKTEVAIETLVPGDVITLAAGDLVPVDIRILSSRDLFISQAPLTGESVAVEKDSIEEPKDTQKGLFELRNLCFAGSNVVSGTAIGIVLKTGSKSYFGSIAHTIGSRREPTSFEKGIQNFTWLMIRFMMVMVPIVFIVNGLTKHEWVDAFLFAVAVAVGLTPEMLPMIVTVNLAKGALSMSKQKVVVKRLNSIQNFGAMDVLCTDKTGTLTEDRVVLEKYVDVTGKETDEVLTFAFLNSLYQTGLKSLLDIAVLKHVELHKELRTELDFAKIDEIPFDFSRRRMSVVVSRQQKTHILICKGALEEIYKQCDHIELDGQIRSAEDEVFQRSHQVARELNEDGLRVIAVAYKELPPTQTKYSVADESGMILLGFIAFLDPPKETAAEAIRGLNAKGVQVKILTGDNDIVTRKVAGEVGIPNARILLGSEIEKLTEDRLDEEVENCCIFAKLSPAQKERIVRSMHRRGHVVGFMGDGINDSPALKAADVGISVDNAVDIAKESADIILLEKSLLVLEEGVIEGRRVFGNIVKYIRMGASSNFGNVFSMMGASMILPFLPIQPVQLLIQNLLYDLSQTAIPLDRVDEEYLAKPRRWSIEDVKRFMFYMGPVSSIFDYVTFAVMWFVFKANTPADQKLFQSGWFVEGLLSQTLIVHMVRTQKIPFIESRATKPLVFTTLAVMAAGLAIPYTPWAASVDFVKLPPVYFVWLAGILLVYGVVAQNVKQRFVRKFGFN